MSDEARAGVLANMVHQATIDALASGRFYERGAAYLREGRVGPVRRRGRRLSAVVRGTDDYRVELWANGGSLAFHCTCPVATDGAFCKHCVAVALSWLAEGAAAPSLTVPPTVPDPSPARPDAVLDGGASRVEREAFVEGVVERARRDPALRAALLERLGALI